MTFTESNGFEQMILDAVAQFRAALEHETIEANILTLRGMPRCVTGLTTSVGRKAITPLLSVPLTNYWRVSMSWPDPIVEEVRRVRDASAKQFNPEHFTVFATDK